MKSRHTLTAIIGWVKGRVASVAVVKPAVSAEATRLVVGVLPVAVAVDSVWAMACNKAGEMPTVQLLLSDDCRRSIALSSLHKTLYTIITVNLCIVACAPPLLWYDIQRCISYQVSHPSKTCLCMTVFQTVSTVLHREAHVPPSTWSKYLIWLVWTCQLESRRSSLSISCYLLPEWLHHQLKTFLFLNVYGPIVTTQAIRFACYIFLNWDSSSERV